VLSRVLSRLVCSHSGGGKTCSEVTRTHMPCLHVHGRRWSVADTSLTHPRCMRSDLGFNDVDFQIPNHSVVKTPTLRKLAHAGIVLANHHVQPFCSPTRATLMTGRHVLRWVHIQCACMQITSPRRSDQIHLATLGHTIYCSRPHLATHILHWPHLQLATFHIDRHWPPLINHGPSLTLS
jgi:hypothetical protein